MYSFPWLAGLTLVNINRMCWLSMTAVQCCTVAVVSGIATGETGGLLMEQAAVYFGPFCLTQLQCQRAPTEHRSGVAPPLKSGTQCNFLGMEMRSTQNNSLLFYTLRR